MNHKHPWAVWAWFLLGAAPGFGAVFNASPTLDAFVTTGPSGNLADNNYGGAGALSVAAPGNAQGEFQSVVRFNLAGAAAAFNAQFGTGVWSVESVSLRLGALSGNNPIFNESAAGMFGVSWMQSDTWTEGNGGPSVPSTSGITFNSLRNSFMGAGDQDLGTFGFGGGTSGLNQYALGLAPGFTAEITAGGDVSLRLFAANGTMSGVFASRNNGTAANRPVLIVVAVPEPGLMALTGLGMALVLAWNGVRTRNG